MLLILQGHSTFQNELYFTILQDFFASFTKLSQGPPTSEIYYKSGYCQGAFNLQCIWKAL